MSESTHKSTRKATRPHTVHEALQAGRERLQHDIETLSKEELAEKLTTYTPGVPHFWFGRPVAPLTKEELLAHWNGGPEPEIRYLDVPQPEPANVTAK